MRGVKASICVSVLLLALMVAPVYAESQSRTYTAEGGILKYKGALKHEERPDKAGKILDVYEGEKILFWSEDAGDSVAVTISGPCDWDGDPYDEYAEYSVEAGSYWDAEGKRKGYYKITDADGNGGWFRIKEHEISIEIVGEVEKVQEGENFSLEMKKNEREEGVMKLTIEDEDGFSIEDIDGNDIYEVLLRYKGKNFLPYDENRTVAAPNNKTIRGISIESKEGRNILTFDTSKTDMKEGKYKIVLEDYATEAEDDVEIEVERKYLDVECDEEVVKGNDIVITIKSSFYNKKANITIGDWTSKEVTLDKDGKKRVKIPTENADLGRYKVTISVCDMTETRYISIVEGEVSVDAPESATVGDVIEISGEANFGDFAIFLVDDVFTGEGRVDDGEFHWYWDTTGESEGYHEVEVFVLSEEERAKFSYSLGERVDEEWQREQDVYASVSIFLNAPSFNMSAPSSVAEGDDVIIRGRATGTDQIFLIVINHEGEVVYPADKIAHSTPVMNGSWEENLGTLDCGMYVVIALHMGRDGKTNAIRGGMWEVGKEGKTMEQRVEIIESAISSAGSDDLYEKAFFTVSSPKVTLKVPEYVEIGDAIEVIAETNIKDSESAVVTLSKGSRNIDSVTSYVEDGEVKARFNTSSLEPGEYSISVDISGRASDEKFISLVASERKEKEEASVEEEAAEGNVSGVEKKEERVNASVNETGVKERAGKEGEKTQKTPIIFLDLFISLLIVYFLIKEGRIK